MNFVVMDVTPELAAKWLENNPRNRRLINSAVNKYASDMSSGNWDVGTDAIGIDDDGNLTNGQHRLTAVVRSGATVPMLVCFGAKRNAHTDTQVKRNDRQNAYMSGMIEK